MNDVVLELPFRPRARLLQLLGDQLIGTPRLAVFELVKNAYDADAETVQVSIEDIDTDDPHITILDDGSGMSLATIRDIWLVPAHNHRQVQRYARSRTNLNRLPLGEKGLGRFAVHKLGDEIELVTRATNENEVVVKINWASLIEEEFLSDAIVEIVSRTPQVFIGDLTGTQITIRKLRNTNWSRGEVRKLLRQITSIASPFRDRSDKFETILRVPSHPDWVESIPDIQVLLSRAPWFFKFEFDQGSLNWTYEFRGVSGIKLEKRVKQVNAGQLLIANERYSDTIDSSSQSQKSKKIVAGSNFSEGIGPVTGEFYVFDRDKELLSRLGESQLVQSFLDESGGVRIYRDGIRVYNYGEPGDDWLGLDLRRVNTPTRNISRNIIVGAIDLSLENSDMLIEKTNREGFVENEHYSRLKQIVLSAMSIFEIERKIDKEKIRTLSGKGFDLQNTNIKQPLDELRKAVQKHGLVRELTPLIDNAEKNFEIMKDTMLRSGLSGMGLAIVFHEIEQGVRILYNAIEQGNSLDSVKVQAKELVRILDGFSELLRKGERRKNSLKNLVRKARDINKVRFRSHGVTLVCPALEDESKDIESIFSFGLMLGALNNLLDNAFYWLQVRWPSDIQSGQRKIFIDINEFFEGGPAIVIADNGPGFVDDPEQLRRPFFSRRPDGMGVGLYYSSMVMELNNGRLLFPDATEANIPGEFEGAVIALVFSGVSED